MSVDRRKFLMQLSAAVGGLLLPWRPLPGFRDSWAARPRRRHLVNMVGAGGWDSSWFHGAFSQAALENVHGAHISHEKGGFEYDRRDAPYRFTQKCASADEAEMLVHPRSEEIMEARRAFMGSDFQSGRGSRLLTGPGMRAVFDQSDLNDFLVWRGLIPAGGHGFGNNLILHGNSSSYALSFSSVVSQALQRDHQRQLHYVMMAETPGRLFSNAAMAEGFGVPICIPDVTQFKELTEIDRDDLREPELRGVLSEAVRALTRQGLGDKVALDSSRTAVSSFGSSFDGAIHIYGSNFAESAYFKWIHKRYILAMVRAMRNASQDPNIAGRGALFEARHPYYNYRQVFDQIGGLSFAPLPPLEQAMAEEADPDAMGLLDVQSLNPGGALAGTVRSFWRQLQNHAYMFAFADFLVRTDLSAVVDIPAWPGMVDKHSEHFEEVVSVLRTMAGFREMIKSFKEVPLEGGGTLYDATLMVMHTEFDRWYFHEAKAFNQTGQDVHVGTNHADTASILMAGYGVNNGMVVGDIHQGPDVHGAFGDDYLSPLPIHPVTGVPTPVSEGGMKISTLAIFPTILRMFRLEVPIQQVTDWHAVDAVIRKG